MLFYKPVMTQSFKVFNIFIIIFPNICTYIKLYFSVISSLHQNIKKVLQIMRGVSNAECMDVWAVHLTVFLFFCLF